MALWDLGSATVKHACNETDGIAISYNQFKRIHDTFDTRVLSLPLSAVRSPTVNINIGSLTSISDTARANTIDSLAALYQRQRAAAPVQRNRIQYYNDDSDYERIVAPPQRNRIQYHSDDSVLRLHPNAIGFNTTTTTQTTNVLWLQSNGIGSDTTTVMMNFWGLEANSGHSYYMSDIYNLTTSSSSSFPSYEGSS